MPARVTVDQNHTVDLSSLNEIPETHAWSSWKDEIVGDIAAGNTDFETIPVVDLNDENALNLIGNACRNWGVFQVINHGIPQTLSHELEIAAVDLFSLPMHIKMQAARAQDGLTGYGPARISKFFSKRMWSEGFTIMGSPSDHARLLWPHNHLHFCETVENYQKTMKELAKRLMWLMLGALGISEEDLKWARTRGFEPGSALQLNSYPICPEPDRAMGLAAHTDSTILTILHQNTAGLQIHTREGRWIPVAPITGGLVVHVGDLMHILSNGAYKSAVHRAVVNRIQRRVSVAFHFGPPSEVKIAPVEKLIDEWNPAIYRAITWKDYLAAKGKLFDKALNSVRVSIENNM